MLDFFPAQTKTLSTLGEVSGLFVQVTGLPGVGVSTWLRQRAKAREGLYLDLRGFSSVYEVDAKLALLLGDQAPLEAWLHNRPASLLCMDHVSASLYDELSAWFSSLPSPPSCALINTTTHLPSTAPTIKLARPAPERVRGWAKLHLAHLSEPTREVILRHVQDHPAFILAWATYAHFVPEAKLLEQMPTTIAQLLEPSWQQLPQAFMATLARFAHPIEGEMLASLMRSFELDLSQVESFLAMGWLVRSVEDAHRAPLYTMHGVCRQFVQAQPVEPERARYIECIDLWCAQRLPMSAQVLQQRFDDVYRAWQDVKQTGQEAAALREVISWMMSAVSMSTSLAQLPKLKESWDVQLRRDLDFGDHLGATRKLLWAQQQPQALMPPAELGQLWSVLGKLHRMQGRYHDAAEAYERAVTLLSAHDPQGRRLHKYLWRAIECHQHTKRATRALELLQQLEALAPGSIPQTSLTMERIRHTLIHDDAQAQRLGVTLLGDETLGAQERAQVTCWLADVFLRAGQLKLAQTHYAQALELVDEDGSPAGFVASLRGRLIDLALIRERPLPSFDEALLQAHPGGLLRAALIHMHQGLLEQARQRFERFLERGDGAGATRVLVRHVVMMLYGEPADQVLSSLMEAAPDASWSPHELAIRATLIAKCRDELVEQALVYWPDEALPCAMVWVFHRWQPPSMASLAQAALLCERQGRWFQCAQAPRVELERKHTARRLLASLIAQHLDSPALAISFDALFAQGWPGQSAIKQSAARNRLRVSINRLRAMGLDAFIITTDDGYMLDPALHIEVVHEP